MLPLKYREDALRLAHRAPLAGHFGRARTLERLVRVFFWPGISIAVKETCQCCPTCQLTAPRKTATAPLIALPVICPPFQRVAMDMIGPLPEIRDGYKYILTVVDYGTGYPESFPLRTTTSSDVVEALVELFGSLMKSSRTAVPTSSVS